LGSRDRPGPGAAALVGRDLNLQGRSGPLDQDSLCREPWVGMAGLELPRQGCCHTLGEVAPPDQPPGGDGVWVQWD